MSTVPRRSLWKRLYNGETAIEFVRRWPRWFMLSGVVILIGLASLGLRGLKLGIDFEGGTVWSVPAGGRSVADARDAVRRFGLSQAKIQTVSTAGTTYLRIQGDEATPADAQKVVSALAKFTSSTENDVNVQSVGPSWGRDVSRKAVQALVAFFLLIATYISIRFEWKMAASAIVAVLHDILITVGIYSLSGFEVTPATVVAFLTILGFSLYDTIVVFDKVEENVSASGSTGRQSYTDIVNTSMNQVLMRSLNTSIAAVLPVLSLLIVGSGIMGAVALREFSLALLVGLITGSYSSIYVATPLLSLLKEREPRYRNTRGQHATGAELERMVHGGSPEGHRREAARARRSTAEDGVIIAPSTPSTPQAVLTHPPRPRKKKRR